MRNSTSSSSWQNHSSSETPQIDADSGNCENDDDNQNIKVQIYPDSGSDDELGVVNHLNRDIAFQNSYHCNEFIKNIMTNDRFDAIIYCWRFEDYFKSTPAERATFKVGNLFWIAIPLILLVANSF